MSAHVLKIKMLLLSLLQICYVWDMIQLNNREAWGRNKFTGCKVKGALLRF